MMGSRAVTRFTLEGEEYDVVLQASDAERMTPADLTNLFVRSPGGELVSVGSLVEVSEEVGPTRLNRFNRLRSITISAQIDEAHTLGQAMAEVEVAVRDALPAEAQLSWDGESREFADSTYAVYFAFGLALLVVFLVLAAQFESFIHPTVILGTVPLGLVGALGAVTLFGMPVTLYTQIGLIMLIGLVAKNAILVVEFVNQLRRAGADIETAILDAASIRLRPILMTSLATIMSAVPLAFAVGAGSEARAAIGIIVVGGVLVGTVLSLFISPALYLVFCRRASLGLEGAKELDMLLGKRQRPAE
jgi:multidrug efflux pump